MKRKIQLIGIAFAAIALLVSCYPSESLNYSDLDVAVTNYDEEFNFEVGDVFFLDTVIHVVGKDEEPPTKAGPYDKLIRKTVLENINKTLMGNGEVHIIKDTSEIPVGITPDLVVTMTVLETDYYSYYSYPWWGYWGYWGWGWYWKSGELKSAVQEKATNYWYPWYPWYPGGGVSYSYTIGSVNIDLLNFKDSDIENELMPVAWTGVANGMRSNNSQDEANRIEKQINQCFSQEQSPYLY
jgi:hypothetical protein